MAWHQTDLVQGKSNLVSVQEDIVTGYFELLESWIRSLQAFVTFNNQHQYHRLAFSIITHKNWLSLEWDASYAQTALERAGFGKREDEISC